MISMGKLDKCHLGNAPMNRLSCMLWSEVVDFYYGKQEKCGFLKQFAAFSPNKACYARKG